MQSGPALREAVAPPEARGIERDCVRMLVTDRAGRTHSHRHFLELPSVLRDGDLLVVNDSATLPAALLAHRANGKSLALHVSTMIDRRVWTAEPRAQVVGGEELRLPGNASAVMIAPVEPERPRLWYAWFQLPEAMNSYLGRFGQPIRYRYVAERFPLADYQTMFARSPGSSEMPSAGRPFTQRVIEALRKRNVGVATITLHCAVASFEAPELPALERYAVSPQAAQAINAAKREKRRVVAVGTTVVRALESAVYGGEVVAASGWTDLVVDERRGVTIPNALLTGFHDAGATHQWILRAFADRQLIGQAYAHAAGLGYYQHEFGDVHLIV